MTNQILIQPDHPNEEEAMKCPEAIVRSAIRDSDIRHKQRAMLTHIALGLCTVVFWFLCETALATEMTGELVNLELRHIDSNSVIATPLSLETDVDMVINGPIVRATISQIFENPSQNWVEGTYTYPLPEGAAVDQLTMRVGELVIEGQIKEKRAARNLYSKARNEGKRAVLLEKPKGNLFTTRVANIAPGARIQVEFSYQSTLDFKDHGYNLRVPVVATPQYDPNVQRGKPATLPIESQIDYLQQQDEERNPVAFKLEIGTGSPVERLWSDSHPLEVDKLSDTTFIVKAGGVANASNRDFLLSWRYAAKDHAQVSLFTEEVGGEYYNMLMLMPPASQSRIDSSARELIFVLDVSGSMQGPSIRQAKEAIRASLGNLDESDYFNIVFFNDRAWPVFKAPRPATSGNLLRARYALDKQEADRGTEMVEALKLALDNRDGQLFRQVIFITDGAVSNEDALLMRIKNTLSDTRLFTVGIGSAPNSYFMRRASELGRGTFTYINDVSQVQQKMQSLFEKINHPVLKDIEITLDVPLLDLMPNPTPDLYMDEAGYLLFRTQMLPKELHVEAQHGDRPAYLQQHIFQAESIEGIAVEWARLKIRHLTERALNTTSEGKGLIKAEATELALKHHQVSQYTSLVAVDVTPVRAGAELMQHKLKSNLPKGWQSVKSDAQVYHLAQTATLAPWMTQVGLFWLCIAIVLWLITRFCWARPAISCVWLDKG